MKPFKVIFNVFLVLFLAAVTSSGYAQQVKANFSSDLRSGCSPMIVNFSDLSTGNPISWKWNLGDGTISYLQNPIATYFNPGSYTVKLVVKNANSADSVVKTQFITVNAAPTAKFGASDTTGCFPLPIQFTDSSIAGSGTIATWQWDFGDGTLSSLQNPKHVYTGAGNFTVTLRVVNSNGCVKVFTRPSYIKISKGVKADFTYVSASACHPPTSVAFTNTSVGTGVVNYSWSFGDGNSSTQINPVNLYQVAGSYTIKLIATNSTGCSDTLIRPNALNVGFVKANFSKPDSVCIGQTVTITNTSNPNTVASSWNFGDGTSSTLINPAKAYSAAGTYQIKLVNDFGGCKDSIVKSIQVFGNPVVSFTGLNTSGCSVPLTTTFTDGTTGATNYIWSFGDGTFSSMQNPTHTFNLPGSYTVTLKATNAVGCVDSLAKAAFVKIILPRITRIDSLPKKGCLPVTINPTAVVQSTQPVASYFWDFGDGATSTSVKPTHTYTVPGRYNVKLVITTEGGCADSLIIVDAVKAGNKPQAAFSATPLDICASIRVPFTNQSTGLFDESFWTFGDGGSASSTNPIHAYGDTGTFTVMLVASSFGCTDTAKKIDYIRVSPPIAAFTLERSCTDRLTVKFTDKSIAATTWEWSFGDGTSSTLQSPVHLYAQPGDYQVILKVSNGSCQHLTSQPVKVVKEQGVLVTTDSIACRNANVTFNVSNINRPNIASYAWYLDNFTTPTLVTNYTPVTFNYTKPGTRSFAVITTNALGCLDTLYGSAPIKVYGPTAAFTASTQASCYKSGINFIDTSATDGVNPINQWIWNYGDTVQNYTTPPFSHSYSSAGSFGVSLTVVDSRGCRDSISKPAYITIGKPTADFTLQDTTICPGTSLVLRNTSKGVKLAYNWNFGNGVTLNDSLPKYNYPAEGDYTITLTVTDKYGCTDVTSRKVRVFVANASFMMSDSFSTCPPLLVNFTSGSDHFASHAYDFGDGGISTLLNPSHLYTYPGTYTVKRWALNNGGCTDTVVKTIVIQGPVGTFTYNPLQNCNPASVNFKAVTENCVSYVWDYNDGSTIFSTQTATSHKYTTPGIYVPKIILEDASGCRVPVVGKDTIKVNGIETFILAQRRLLCDSGQVAFTDSTLSNDIVAGYLWDFGDNTTSTQRSPVHNYTNTGWYTVSLTTTTTHGCVATEVKPKYIKIVNSPDITILGNSAACEPASLLFQGSLLRSDTATLSWSWDFGNGQTSNQQNPSAQTYASAGSYTLTSVVTNMDGCTDTTRVPITIHPKPAVNAGPDTLVCRDQSFTLQPSGASTYTWNAEPTLSCVNCTTPVATPLVTTTYVVTGTTTFGCTNKDTITIAVKQPFKMKVGKGDTLCVNEKFKLSASGADLYQWSPSLYLDDPTSATPLATPQGTISYQVIGRDNKNCFFDTAVVDLKVYAIPVIEIKGDSIRTLSVGSQAQLETNSSSDITKWRWSPSLGLSCTTCASTVTSTTQSIVYTVVATNDGDCVARDQVSVIVICNNANIYMPNTFSPNGDGMNDIFYPRGKGVFSIRSLKVFNRWGQVVFERGATNANDPSQGWDGTNKGVKLEPDVFVYMADIVCENGTVFPMRGNVTLIR